MGSATISYGALQWGAPVLPHMHIFSEAGEGHNVF